MTVHTCPLAADRAITGQIQPFFQVGHIFGAIRFAGSQTGIECRLISLINAALRIIQPLEQRFFLICQLAGNIIQQETLEADSLGIGPIVGEVRLSAMDTETHGGRGIQNENHVRLVAAGNTSNGQINLSRTGSEVVVHRGVCPLVDFNRTLIGEFGIVVDNCSIDLQRVVLTDYQITVSYGQPFVLTNLAQLCAGGAKHADGQRNSLFDDASIFLDGIKNNVILRPDAAAGACSHRSGVVGQVGRLRFGEDCIVLLSAGHSQLVVIAEDFAGISDGTGIGTGGQ